MNKRQKKKMEDRLLIRLKKLHPGKGDFILMEFDPDKIDINVTVRYFNALVDTFNNIINLVMIPNGISIKSMGKDDALKYIEKSERGDY